MASFVIIHTAPVVPITIGIFCFRIEIVTIERKGKYICISKA